MNATTQRAAVVQVLVAATLFGTVGTARALGPEASAASLGAARVVLAAALLVPLAAAADQRWLPALRRPSVWAAAGAQAGFQVCFLSAVLVTGVATGTLLAIGSAPLFAGLLHRRTSGQWAIATTVGLAGLVLLVLHGSAAQVQPAGVLLALGAGFSYAAYTVAAGRAVRAGTAAFAATAAIFVLAGLLLSPALLLADAAWLARPAGLALAAWLALGPTVASYLLLARGLRHLAPPVVTTLGLAEPLAATVLAVVVLGERPTAVGWVGALLVLAGLLITAVAPRREVAVRGSVP